MTKVIDIDVRSLLLDAIIHKILVSALLLTIAVPFDNQVLKFFGLLLAGVYFGAALSKVRQYFLVKQCVEAGNYEVH